MAQSSTTTVTWTCDHCGATEQVVNNPQAPLTWFYLSQVQGGVSAWFCSAPCASTYAAGVN